MLFGSGMIHSIMRLESAWLEGFVNTKKKSPELGLSVRNGFRLEAVYTGNPFISIRGCPKPNTFLCGNAAFVWNMAILQY